MSAHGAAYFRLWARGFRTKGLLRIFRVYEFDLVEETVFRSNSLLKKDANRSTAIK
jgi:hypothetical protein